MTNAIFPQGPENKLKNKAEASASPAAAKGVSLDNLEKLVTPPTPCQDKQNLT